jgi:predicted dehydrogenase
MHVVVGLGSAGERHLSLLAEAGVGNLGVVRTFKGPTRRATPPGVREFLSTQEAITAGAVAFVVATPSSVHADQVRSILASGIPVLVEKPLTTSAAESSMLVSLAQERQTLLRVGFHLRNDPILQWLVDLCRSGELGKPLLLLASWGEYLPDWHPGEDFRRGYAARTELGGGPLLTLSHVVDYAALLLGEGSVVNQASLDLSDLDLEVPDTQVLTIQHRIGAFSILTLDFWTRPRQHRAEIRFESGVVTWDVNSGEVKVASAYRPDGHDWNIPEPIERMECFRRQMQRFLEDAAQGVVDDNQHDLVVARLLET